MIKKAKFTYGKMDMDTSPSKSKPEFYYKGNNIRVITVGDNTSQSVSNTKGTKHLITIPTIFNNSSTNPNYIGKFSAGGVDYYYNNPSLVNIPTQSNLVILGMKQIRDELVIFTTSTTGSGFSESIGQIWTLNVSNIDSPVLELKYNAALGFSINNPIKSIVNKYENEKVVKTYFTDFNNTLRFFNLRSENSFDIEPRVISASPEFIMSQPKLVSITAGSVPAGLTGYAYVLYTRDGASSKVSAISNLYDSNSGLGGFDTNVSSGMGYKMKIDNIDTDYSFIKIFRLQYTSVDQVPSVYVIREENVTSSSMEFSDDGVTNIAASSLEEVLFSGNDPFICKTIKSKENRLIAGNIRYKKFSVDYDARTYRFDNTGKALLKDSSDPDIVVTNDYDIVPKEFDCINPSNKEEPSLDYRQLNSTQNPNYQKYIYQSDGTTIGAEGKNLKLEFIFKNRKIDSTSLISEKEFTPINSKRDKSETTLYASLKRDEVYRYGIVFIKSTGQLSFPLWMCDLRVPNQNETGFNITTRNQGELELVSVGVKVSFKNVPVLPKGVIGWRIVRAKREVKDRTILAQGIVNSLIKSPYLANNAGSPGYANNALQPDYIMRSMHTGVGTSFTSFNNTVDLNSEIGSQASSSGDHYKMLSSSLQLYTPEVIFDTSFSTAPSDFITIVGGIENPTGSSGSSKTWVYQDDKDNLWGTYNYLNLRADYGYIIPYDQSKYLSTIRKGGLVYSNDIGKADIFGEAYVTPEGGSHKYYNGFGTTSFFNRIFINRRRSNSAAYKNISDNGKCITFDIGLSAGAGNGIEKVVKDGTSELFPVNDNPKFIMVDYKRPVLSQYGGDNYEAIQRTNYIPVGDFTPITQLYSEAFNGDTYVTMFNMSRTEVYSPDQFLTGSSFRETIIFPVESYSNLELRFDEESNYSSEIQKIETRFNELYKYNTVYSQINDSQVIASKPFNFVEIEEFDTRLQNSEIKINGEITDNWVNFLTNNYIDLEGDFGPVMALEKWKNRLFAFQEEGVAMITISPRYQVSAGEGQQVQLGEGKTLDDYVYLSTTNGIVNQNAVVSAPNGLYYYDGKDNTINMLSGNQEVSISMMNGVHSFLKPNVDFDIIKEDNLLLNKGVVGHYDEQTKHVIFTFKQIKRSNELTLGNPDPEYYTLLYHDMLQGFTSFMPETPSLYAETDHGMVSTNSNNNAIYIHHKGEYGSSYEETKDSSVTLLLNPDADNSKIFDTILFNSSVLDDGLDVALESLTKIRIYNEHQDSGYVNLVQGKNITRRFREWRIQLPRERNTRNRIRGQHAYLELVFSNNNNKFFRLDDIILTYTLLPASFI